MVKGNQEDLRATSIVEGSPALSYKESRDENIPGTLKRSHAEAIPEKDK